VLKCIYKKYICMANLSIKLIKKFYYKDGLSCKEIGDELNINQWAILSFMRRKKLPRRSFKEANALKFAKKPLSYCIKSNLSPKEQRLKVAALMLYWAEGQTDGYIDLANSDTKMIKIFLRFLREICGVTESKIKVYLYCYANQDVSELMDYWKEVTGIPLEQFQKPYIRYDFDDSKKGKMEHGLAHIRYHDKKLFFQIKKWTGEYIKKNS